MPCRGACLRSDSRATAMVTAAASSARPATWTPISRPSSGNWAETFATRARCGPGRATGDGAALGCGVTSGNEATGGLEPGTGPGRPPSAGAATPPVPAPMPGGSVAPTPEMGATPPEPDVPGEPEEPDLPDPGELEPGERLPVGDGLAEGVCFPPTTMVSMLDGAGVPGESVAVATVKVRCCPAVAVLGIATVACLMMGWLSGAMAPSEQAAAAVAPGQSANRGVIPLVSGLSVTETLIAGGGGVDGGAVVEVGQAVGLGVPLLPEPDDGLGEAQRLASHTSML